jgi:mannose-6-phosphate isomerase-like protein (cupin superfamily)
MPAGLAIPQRVEKRWGWEDIYINWREYCMKRLYIKAGHDTSMHFHVDKHETLLVVEGVLTLSYKDGKGGDHRVLIPRGEAFVVPPGFQHKLIATTTDVTLIEASTMDDTEDSIRVHI